MPIYSGVVNVTLKDSVLDPQGKAVLSATGALGLASVVDVRAGKTFVVKVDSVSKMEARKTIEAMCAKLLVNPIIEKYWIDENSIKVEGVSG